MHAGPAELHNASTVGMAILVVPAIRVQSLSVVSRNRRRHEHVASPGRRWLPAPQS